jgi:hypothetical protein
MKQSSEIACPSRTELDAWPVAEAGLCIRAVHCLTAAGVRTVGELRGFSKRDLLQLPHFGVKSLRNVHWFFRWVQRIEKQDVPFLVLPELLGELLNKQELSVLEQRYGLTDPLFRPHLKWRTLQEIADASGGLARERVRQVEEAGTEKLQSRLGRTLMLPLEAHWVHRLVAQGGIVTCRELTDWAGDQGLGRYQPWGALRLMATASRHIHSFFDYYTILSAETVSRVETRALDLLCKAHAPQSLANLLPSLQPEFGQHQGDVIRLLTVMLQHHPAIDGTRDGNFFLSDQSAGWFLTGMLRDSGRAVPLETLRHQYNEQMLPHSQKSTQALVRVLNQLPPVSRVGAALYRWRKD